MEGDGMVYGKDELLYVTGMGNIVKNKQNTEGSEMVKRYDIEKNEVKVENSVLHKMGIDRKYEDMKYIENGIVYASGEGVLSTVESFLSGYLGYDLTDIDNDYEWVDYPRNSNYEVSELGLIRNKKRGTILNMMLKCKYYETKKEGELADNKDAFRIKVTIPGVGSIRVSHVVAETFLGDKPEIRDVEGNLVTVVVGHKNDMPIDNRVDNLEYITDDENKTIDWVLREVANKRLNIDHVNVVYGQILDVLEDKHGEGIEVLELNDEDEEEVTEHVDIYKRSVGEIYKYKKYGTGILANLTLIDGNFYI